MDGFRVKAPKLGAWTRLLSALGRWPVLSPFGTETVAACAAEGPLGGSLNELPAVSSEPGPERSSQDVIE